MMFTLALNLYIFSWYQDRLETDNTKIILDGMIPTQLIKSLNFYMQQHWQNQGNDNNFNTTALFLSR